MKVVASDVILAGVINVRKDHLVYPNGYEYDYIVVSSTKEAVCIVALSPTGQILVTKEYRHAVQKVVTGFPGGCLHEGETPEEAARRELLEEAGCTAASFEVIGECYPLPGLLAQKMHVVVARGAKIEHDPTPEVTESIQAFFVDEDAILAMPDLDGTMCTALLLKQKNMYSSPP